MALDPSIILRDISPKFEPYENMLAKQMQIKAQEQQLKAQRQQYDENAFKMQSERDAMQQQNALAQLLGRQGFNSQSPEGQSELYRTGGVSNTQKLMKSQADIAKARSDAEKIEIENHFKKFELAGQLMNGVTDQASYDVMKAQASKIPAIADAVQHMPAVYDPAGIEAAKAKAMSVKDKLELRYKELTQAETGRHNLATEVIQIRGQDRQSFDNAEGRKVQMLGQRMTDERARDLNATRVEDNRIKREAKDDTNNLTRQGQLASFDTMLGTLDRLGKHPGLSRSVGVMGVLPTIPGSDSANFQAELNTFQSQAFLPMVSQLKGMGALSDAEGKKLTAAVGALDPKMGEKAFRESVGRITAEMDAAKSRVAGGGSRSSMVNQNQDSAAMAWARANPNDPRAAKIMQLQGR